MLNLSWKQPPNDYPTSDGKPVGETEPHRDLLFDILYTLKHFFRDQPGVHVTGNLLWFYQQGNRRRHLSPDVMVCFGVRQGVRLNYLQWEEGCAPQVVFEFSSESTEEVDRGKKRTLYEQLGVEEYYLFDPRKNHVVPRLRAFHSHNDSFVPVLGDTVYSRRLGLEVLIVGDTLRIRDPATHEILLTTPERAERAELETSRADREAVLRQEAERQLAEMKLLLEQLRKGEDVGPR